MGNACLSGPAPVAANIVLVQSPTHKKLGIFAKHISPVHETGGDPIRTVKVNTLVMSPKGGAKKERRQNGIQQQSQAIEEQATEAGGTEHASARGELTLRDKEIIASCWRRHIAEGSKRDLFHKTMLRCIEASPKLNEIIACGRYCYRDLTKWPKLNRICQAQFKFYERLIFELQMDEARMREACTRLGETHAGYAQYGLKPHFLDIYQQSLLAVVAKLNFADDAECEQCVQAFGRLSRFIIDVMMAAYGQRVAELRIEERRQNGAGKEPDPENGSEAPGDGIDRNH